MDCSLSGSSVHEITQARILEWLEWNELYVVGIYLLEKHLKRQTNLGLNVQENGREYKSRKY